MEEINIKRTFDIKDASVIHSILYDAFKYIEPLYTKEAFEATVVSISDLERRIKNHEYDVLIAHFNNEAAGTASLKLDGAHNLYLMSMAVAPKFHGKGLGNAILKEVQKIALHRDCLTISLETSEPLKNAIRLYEKFGFKRTGMKRDYHGVTIFEMVKQI